MVVLTAIGAFFKKIWDWIRQTAWVQPLLIVGIIFGIIFSIPAIVNAIKNAQEEAAAVEKYYHNYQLSLEGASESEADKTTKLIFDAMENPSEENVKAVTDNVGANKFFFVYVEDNCEHCLNNKYGFDYLEKHWGDFVTDGSSFKLASVFADEITSETTADKSAFIQYMERKPEFFEAAGAAAYNSDFYELKGIAESDIDILSEANYELFTCPVIMLVDFTDKVDEKGITEVIVGDIQGESDLDKAKFLLHCWNHTDEFSINNKTE